MSASSQSCRRGYREIVPVLWDANVFDEVIPLAETLVSNFWKLLRDEGVEVMNYQDVSWLPL